MARQTGGSPLSITLRIDNEGMIDDRHYCGQFSDLLTYTASDYIPIGFPVIVATTTTYQSVQRKRGWYQCINNTDMSLVSSWEYMGGVDFSGTNNKIPKFSNGSIVDSQISELNSTNFLFNLLRLNISNLSETRVLIAPNKSDTIATLSDIQGTPNLGNRDTLDPSTAYLVDDDIYYIDEQGKVRYFEVLVGFTSAATINDAYVNGLVSANTLLEVFVSNIVNIAPFDINANILYTQHSITWDESTQVWYIALEDNNGVPLETESTWRKIFLKIDNDGNDLLSVFTTSEVVSRLATKENTSLSEDNIRKGNSSNTSEEVAVEKVYPDTHLGYQELTQDWLNLNKGSSDLGDSYESNSHIATKSLDGWIIVKKYSNEIFGGSVDFSNTAIWDNVNRILNLTSVREKDFVSLTHTILDMPITAATQNSPCQITVSLSTLRYLDNDVLITISSSSPSNYNGNYMIKNINRVEGIFDLYLPDGVTPVDSSGFPAYVGDAMITYTSGKYEPKIDKILGYRNNQEFYLESGSLNFEPELVDHTLTSIEENDIYVRSGSNAKLVGHATAPSRIKVRKKSNFFIVD